MEQFNEWFSTHFDNGMYTDEEREEFRTVCWLAWRDSRRAIINNGMVIVPREITDEMADAVFFEFGSPSDWCGMTEAYRAMLEAAPNPLNEEV